MHSPKKSENARLVSVIVPCYEQAEFLSEALNSVLEQSYAKWECIIIDDGSTDNTEEVTNLYLTKDTRFKYYYKENGGLPSARNFGISKSKGEYILPLDADDSISHNYLQACVNELVVSNCTLVYGKVVQFGIRSGRWDLGEYSYLDLLAYNMIHCCAMYRKSDWESLGGYDERMRDGLEDWEFYIRLLKNKGQVKLLETITFHYRIKDISMITLMDKTSFRATREYVFKKHAGLYMERLYEMVMEKNRIEKDFQKRTFLFKRLLKLTFQGNNR